MQAAGGNQNSYSLQKPSGVSWARSRWRHTSKNWRVCVSNWKNTRFHSHLPHNPLKRDCLQGKEVHLLERNVELEESCKRVEEQMSLKEQEIMKLDSRCSDLEDEMTRAIEEKEESIESLERKVRRLNTSLETAVSLPSLLICIWSWLSHRKKTFKLPRRNWTICRTPCNNGHSHLKAFRLTWLLHSQFFSGLHGAWILARFAVLCLYFYLAMIDGEVDFERQVSFTSSNVTHENQIEILIWLALRHDFWSTGWSTHPSY